MINLMAASRKKIFLDDLAENQTRAGWVGSNYAIQCAMPTPSKPLLLCPFDFDLSRAYLVLMSVDSGMSSYPSKS